MVRALRWMAVCAMIVVLAGIVLTGCGGGEDTTTSTTVTPTTLAPAAGTERPPQRAPRYSWAPPSR